VDSEKFVQTIRGKPVWRLKLGEGRYVPLPSLGRGLKKQSAVSPLQKFLVEFLLFLSIDAWWSARLFCFRRGGRSDLGRRRYFGLLVLNFRLFFVSLIQLLVSTTLPVIRLSLRVTSLIWPVTRLILPVSKLALPVPKLALPVTPLTVTKLPITKSGNATVTQVRRHYPPVRTLGGDLAAERFTSVALSHCGICKTTQGNEYRNREGYLDHVPTLQNVLPSGRGCSECEEKTTSPGAPPEFNKHAALLAGS